MHQRKCKLSEQLLHGAELVSVSCYYSCDHYMHFCNNSASRPAEVEATMGMKRLAQMVLC